jgi:hypothetical protein
MICPVSTVSEAVRYEMEKIASGDTEEALLKRHDQAGFRVGCLKRAQRGCRDV